MIGSNIDEPCVLSNVIDPARIRTRYVGACKIMPLNRAGLLGGTPFPAAVLVVSEDFLLFRVHGYDRKAQGQSLFNRGANVPELCVSVLVVRAFFGFSVAL